MFLIHQPDDNGDPSVYPQFNTIEKNLLIANYNSQEAVEYVADFLQTHELQLCTTNIPINPDPTASLSFFS